MKIVSICAAVAAGAILMWFPVSMFTGLVVAALVVISLLGGIKTMMGTLYAAPSIAAVAIVAILCATIITLVNIQASAPVRISQEDLDKAKAVAVTAERVRNGIDLAAVKTDLAAAKADRDLNMRALKLAAARADSLEKELVTTRAAAKVASAKQAQEQASADAPFPIPTYYASSRGQWLSGQTKTARLMQRGVPAINDGSYFYADFSASCDGSGHPAVQMLPSGRNNGGSWIVTPDPLRTTVGQLLCRA